MEPFVVSQEKVELLRNMKIYIEIERKANSETPWKERDQMWFCNDARYIGMMKIIEIVLGPEPN